jgi:lipoprotein-anchoring transpeptidase ErfK/SrfK
MNRAALLLPLLAASCSSGPAPAPAPPPEATAEAAATLAGEEPFKADALEEPAPPYGPEVVSLRLRRSIVVRFAPDVAAKNLGTIEAGTRVTWRSAATGPGCDRWIEIDPRGWICDKYLEPSSKPPAGAVLPRLEEGRLVPGEYGKVVGTGLTVRKTGESTVGGRTFWKTTSGKLIDARKIRPQEPSSFAGVWIEPGQTLPLAWTRARVKGGVIVRATPAAKGAAVETLAPRTVVSIVETTGDGWARIGEDRWVAEAELHVARSATPPDDVSGEHERWLDVDLDEQVVVAYEGLRPVFATLVSTGSKKWPTPPGLYRIWLKYSETDMSGQMGDEQPYSVAMVPWTMYFAKDFAFHTAYWHDRFGEPRSHGCINLSPRDARALYGWATPDVPLGWTMSLGIVERPGSMVRIHGKEKPAVEYRGYAKVVREKRG